MVKIRATQDFKHPAAEPEDPGPRDEQVTPGLTLGILPPERGAQESGPSGRFDVRWYWTEVIDHAQAYRRACKALDEVPATTADITAPGDTEATSEDVDGSGTVLGPNPFDLEGDHQLHSYIRWDKAERAAQEKISQLDAKIRRMPGDTFLDIEERVIVHSVGLFDIRAQVLMVFIRPKPYELVLAYTAKAIISNIRKQGGRGRYDLLRKVEERLQQGQEHWMSLARAAEARRLAEASVDNPFGELQEAPPQAAEHPQQAAQPEEAAPQQSAQEPHADGPSYLFRRDGKLREVAFGSERRNGLRDLAGMQIIQELLESPGREISAEELVGRKTVSLQSADDLPDGGNADRRQEEMGTAGGGEPRRRPKTNQRSTMDPVLDPEAIRQIKRQLEDLRIQRAEAVELGDTERQALLTEQAKDIEEFFKKDMGLHGRSRDADRTRDRARRSAAKKLGAAYKALDVALPALAAQLRKAITQGYNLAYRPERDPDTPSGLEWNGK